MTCHEPLNTLSHLWTFLPDSHQIFISNTDVDSYDPTLICSFVFIERHLIAEAKYCALKPKLSCKYSSWIMDRCFVNSKMTHMSVFWSGAHTFMIYLPTGNTHSPHRRKHTEEWAESSGQPEPLHLSYLGYIQYCSPILWISPTPALSRLITVLFPSSSPGDGGCMWWTWLSFPEDSVPAVQQHLWWRWAAVARLRLEAGGRVLTKLTTLIYLHKHKGLYLSEYFYCSSCFNTNLLCITSKKSCLVLKKFISLVAVNTQHVMFVLGECDSHFFISCTVASCCRETV